MDILRKRLFIKREIRTMRFLYVSPEEKKDMDIAFTKPLKFNKHVLNVVAYIKHKYDYLKETSDK